MFDNTKKYARLLGFYPSAIEESQARTLCRKFINDFKTCAKHLGCSKFEIKYNYFDCGGHFTLPNGKAAEIHFGDLRLGFNGYMRMSTDYKDWNGGKNFMFDIRGSYDAPNQVLINLICNS